MNNVKIYENKEFGPVRTIRVDEDVLFCLKDVATALGYSNSRALDHCENKSKHVISVFNSLRKDGTVVVQKVSLSFIPEDDIYRIVSSASVPIGNRKNDFIAWMQSLGFLTKIYLRTRKEIGFGEKLMEALERLG